MQEGKATASRVTSGQRRSERCGRNLFLRSCKPSSSCRFTPLQHKLLPPLLSVTVAYIGRLLQARGNGPGRPTSPQIVKVIPDRASFSPTFSQTFGSAKFPGPTNPVRPSTETFRRNFYILSRRFLRCARTIYIGLRLQTLKADLRFPRQT